MTRLRPGALTACLVLFGFSACSAPAETNAPGIAGLDGWFARDTLIIEANDGNRHTFDIYLATDFEQQRRGLMFVRSMPANMGMLFVYEEPAMRSMWMKNTYISLDLLFARSDGTVASVIHSAQPLSLTPRASAEPVSFVLELNAGTARRLNIRRDSRIIWESDEARDE